MANATLKLSREQLEIMRRRGASMRGPSQEEPKPEPVAQPTPAPQSDDTRLVEAIDRMTAALTPKPQQAREPTAWRFDIERDSRGFAKSIIANPVR